jgi:hypothetical protein
MGPRTPRPQYASTSSKARSILACRFLFIHPRLERTTSGMLLIDERAFSVALCGGVAKHKKAR